MTVNWIFVLIFADSLSSSSTFIHGITDGSLTQSWRLNFSVYVGELRGVILYCIDSDKNQFGVEINRAINNDKVGTVNVNFNKVTKEVSLRSLCGCDPCNESVMTFQAALSGDIVNTTCNSYNSVTLSISNVANEESAIVLHPVPEAIYKSKRKVFVMMGNIGPYVGDINVTVYARRDQMVGCVRAFYYGDGPLTLNGSGTAMQPTCLNSCHGNMCNGGVCRQRSFNSATCDCSTTALNGPYCNRDLTMYVRGGNNSYEKRKDATEMHVKMTWKSLLYKKYCLLEIVSTHARVTISIDKNHLMMASSIISDVSADGVNFVSVNATNNNLVVKSRNDVSKVDFGLSEGTRLHIGFSESDLSCETFEGAYDLLLDWSQWRQTGPSSDKRAHSVGYSNVSTVVHNKQTNKNTSGTIITAIVPTIIVCVVLLLALVTLLYRRSMRQMRIQLHQLTVLSTFSLDRSSRIFTETGVYGKVDDAGNYDYI